MGDRATWGLLDARDIAAATLRARVAGLPVIARHLRLAARAGWAGVVVLVADSDQADLLRAAVADRPPPPGLTVEYTGDPPPADRRYLPLDGTAVYTVAALVAADRADQPPSPLCRIHTTADVVIAERLLARTCRKSIDQDGVVSYFAFRPISRQMTRLVLDTRVTPNHVSLAAMAFGIAAAVVAGFGGYYPVLAAGLLYWVGAVVDCVDGEIARFRIEGSKSGEWLDTLADDVSTYGLLAGLAIGLVADGYDPTWNVIGIGGAAVGFLLQAKLYADLHRWGMTIDTAQYPWFFGAPSTAGQIERGLAGKIFYGVAFLFRRDAFVTGIMILLAFGLRRIAISLLGFGVIVVLVLFLVHTTVTTFSRAKGG